MAITLTILFYFVFNCLEHQTALPGDTNQETCRLSTFSKFPVEDPIDAVVLAQYGFYYTGYKDRVECFRYEKHEKPES